MRTTADSSHSDLVFNRLPGQGADAAGYDQIYVRHIEHLFFLVGACRPISAHCTTESSTGQKAMVMAAANFLVRVSGGTLSDKSTFKFKGLLFARLTMGFSKENNPLGA